MTYSGSEDLNLKKQMRMLERELSEVYTLIGIYKGVYQQASNRIEGMRQKYKGAQGGDPSSLVYGDPGYRRAMERMDMASRQLKALEERRKALNSRVQELMYRS